jgi:hypothetical protein
MAAVRPGIPAACFASHLKNHLLKNWYCQQELILLNIGHQLSQKTLSLLKE